MPAGFTPDGLPIGVELLGRPLADARLVVAGVRLRAGDASAPGPQHDAAAREWARAGGRAVTVQQFVTDQLSLAATFAFDPSAATLEYSRSHWVTGRPLSRRADFRHFDRSRQRRKKGSGPASFIEFGSHKPTGFVKLVDSDRRDLACRPFVACRVYVEQSERDPERRDFSSKSAMSIRGAEQRFTPGRGRLNVLSQRFERQILVARIQLEHRFLRAETGALRIAATIEVSHRSTARRTHAGAQVAHHAGTTSTGMEESRMKLVVATAAVVTTGLAVSFGTAIGSRAQIGSDPQTRGRFRSKHRPPARHQSLKSPRRYIRRIRPSALAESRSPAFNDVIESYCNDCHNDQIMSGDLSLEKFDVAKANENAHVAEKMIRKLRAEMMPPPGVAAPGRRHARSRSSTTIENDHRQVRRRSRIRARARSSA